MASWTSWRLRLPGGAHIVDQGLVGCPVRGTDVEMDLCFGCGSFQNLHEDHEEDLLYLICAARPRQARSALGPLV